jgi:hypothetical protein
MTDHEVQLFLADLAIIIIILLARLLSATSRRRTGPRSDRRGAPDPGADRGAGGRRSAR